MLPLLYVSRLDLVEDADPYFAEWYSRRHAPDLVGAGFLSVSSFRAVRGTPGVCNLYELRDLGAFGPAYQQARASDDEGVRVGELASNPSLAVYEQVVTAGVADDGGTEPRWATAVLAPVITTLRFSVDVADHEVVDCYRASEAARIMAVPGCISIRLGRQIDAGRQNIDRRRWSVFAEWANQASALRWADTETALSAGPEGPLGEVIESSLHVLGRRSVLHHLDAWHGGAPTPAVPIVRG